MPDQDRRLLLATRRGDDHAARELWSRFSGPLRSYAAAVAPGAADDIVQRTFCAVLERPEFELEQVRDPQAWLIAIARREALDWIRAERRERARRKVPRPDRARLLPADPDLSAALAGLPRALREVVVLRHGAGLSMERIAEALGVNRTTLSWRYTQAIERLRAALAGGGRERAGREVCNAAR